MRAFAAERAVTLEVRRFPAGTRTAADAAAAIGVRTGQIVKSLVFVADERPVLVLCCGDNRVSEPRLAELLQAREVRAAKAAEAKDLTGFAIGGVPPFAHDRTLQTVIDADMSRFETVWAAAGLPDAVFPISTADLERLTRATRAAIASDAPGA